MNVVAGLSLKFDVGAVLSCCCLKRGTTTNHRCFAGNVSVEGLRIAQRARRRGRDARDCKGLGGYMTDTLYLPYRPKDANPSKRLKALFHRRWGKGRPGPGSACLDLSPAERRKEESERESAFPHNKRAGGLGAPGS